RRAWLGMSAVGLTALSVGASGRPAAGSGRPAAGSGRPAGGPSSGRGKPTRFQLACMTLPYSRFPLDRALSGIKAAGYGYVAWGTTPRDGAGEVPVMAADATPERAKDLAHKCRDLGLEPLMMFSMVYPEAPNAPAVFRSRIRQAEAGGLRHVLTFRHTPGGNPKLWVERLQQLGPGAGGHGGAGAGNEHGGGTRHAGRRAPAVRSGHVEGR